VSYLAMATGASSTILDDGREFYYPRYIDWLITTPLLLLDLALLALANPGHNVGLITDLIGIDQGVEIFLFLVLDLLSKVFFGFLLLSNHQVIAEASGGAQASRAR
jgi:bacteriorhodopsin